MKRNRIWTALFLAYGALMLWLLFDRPGYAPEVPYWDQVAQQLNLVPFRTLRLFTELLELIQTIRGEIGEDYLN